MRQYISNSTLQQTQAQSSKPAGAPIRIALVDDDQAVHLSVREAFGVHAPQWQLDAYLDPRLALVVIPALRPSPAVVLMDIRMPGLDGIELMWRFGILAPDLPIVMFTACSGQTEILQSIAAGACGYLVKPIAGDALIGALRSASEGWAVWCPQARSALAPALEAGHASEPIGKLSPRESQVLRLLVQGATCGEVALHLGIETSTVNEHVKRIYTKLGVHSRQEAVRRAAHLLRPA